MNEREREKVRERGFHAFAVTLFGLGEKLRVIARQAGLVVVASLLRLS